MGEVQRFSRSDERCDLRPRLGLRSVAEQVHYYRALLDRLLDWEEGLTRNLTGTTTSESEYNPRSGKHTYPALLLRLRPARAVLADTNNSI